MYIYIGSWGGESFSEPQQGIPMLEVRSVQAGFAVPNRVGSSDAGGRGFCRFAALVVNEKERRQVWPACC
mgnify:CR=1 FL=1